LTCKNRLPYNLYCVGGDVKHCSIHRLPGPAQDALYDPYDNSGLQRVKREKSHQTSVIAVNTTAVC